MNKPKLYDYSGFSLRRITEPRFSHILLLLGWPVYFAMYFVTENLIPEEAHHSVHCFVDDLIPFNEYFVVIYVCWYFVVFSALAYTFFYDVPRFRKLQTFLIITQIIGVAWYILWPSRQDLRPEVFPRENIFTQILSLIYAFDTPTGVCPSLHVAFTVGVLSAGSKGSGIPRAVKAFLLVFTVLICLAVCFVKQHSFVDVVAAMPVCLAAEVLVYGKDYWLPRLTHDQNR